MDSTIDEFLLETEEPKISQDQRAELILGALVCCVLALLVAITVFVVVNGWPSFAHNGLSWFGSQGNVGKQIAAMNTAAANGTKPPWTFHAWPLIWSTILTTIGAVTISFVCALFVSVFLVEFAPEPIKRILEPVIRVLASVPSVVYGLIGAVLITPFIGNHVISQATKASVSPVIQLSGGGLLPAVMILSIMITPIMVSMFVEGLRSVPRGWLEGSLALGVNRWRSFWNIAVHSARPALIAGTVLATARAIGEAVMLSMVSGAQYFSPNPFDGIIFFLEPSYGLASAILANNDELTNPPMRSALFAIATVLLFGALLLSLTGWIAKQPMKRFFNVGGVDA